jgi:prepilin signal peptidase PulO-like enzyme (type II secretory pathway)
MTPEHIVGIVTAALFGAAFGSFSNVLAIRWHEEVDLGGRSKCPECGHVIRPQHLVPVFSWLWLRGKCADCGAKIHVQYPAVEAVALILGAIAAWQADPFVSPLRFALLFICTVGFLAPVVMDLRWQELPVEYLVGLGVVGVALRTTIAGLAGADVLLSLAWTLVAIIIGAGVFWLQVALSRGRWLGEGDVWFGGMMGAILGAPALVGLGIYFAYIIGGLWAVAGLASGAFKRGSRLPFAPALATGTMVALWHGETILAWIRHGML